MDITRRTFIGVVGSAVVAATTPDLFRLVVPSVDLPVVGRRYVYEFLVDGTPLTEPAMFELRRADSAIPVIRFGIAPRGIYRWWADWGNAIITRPGEPLLELDGPSTNWVLSWSDEGHHEFATICTDGLIEIRCCDMSALVS